MNLKIEISKSKTLNGIRCVVAGADIKKGEVIEKCPVIIISEQDLSHIENTVLTKYEFRWDDNDECIVLGYGSLINHSNHPNVEYEPDYENKVMVFRAIKNIRAGEELLEDYNQGDHSEPLAEEYTDYLH